MKPANLKETKKSRGTARVKMLIRAHLYWLYGFPVLEKGALSWYCPFLSDPDKRKADITSKHISKAVRTINELQRDYPRALPEVVGDVSEWARQAKAYLAHVKALFDSISSDSEKTVYNLFHEDKAYGRYLSKLPYPKSPGLESILVALSWLCYTQRDSIKPSLQVLQGSPSELSSIADKRLVTAIEIIHLGVVEPDQMHDLRWLAANFDDVAVATIGVSNYVRPFHTVKVTTSKVSKKVFSAGEKPFVIQIDVVFEFIEWLLHLKKDRRKIALQLFNVVSLKNYIETWNAWWNLATPLIDKIINHATYFSEKQYDTCCQLQAELSALSHSQPGEINLKYVFTHIRCLTVVDELGPAALNILSACFNLPLKRPEVLKMLCHIHLLYQDCQHDARLLSTYFKAMANYFKKCNNSNQIEPWENLDQYYRTPESNLLYVLDRYTAPVFFDALYELNNAVFRSVNEEELKPLAFCLASGIEKKNAVHIAQHLLEAGLLPELDKKRVDVFYDLDADGKYAEKLLKLYKNTENSLSDEHIINICFNVFKHNKQIELFKKIIDFNLFKQMIYSCYQMYVIQKIDGAESVPSIPPVIIKNDEWVSLYPEEIRPILRELNGLMDSAEIKVSKIVTKWWWPKALLITELSSINKRLTELRDVHNTDSSRYNNLTKRAANFQKRLDNHQSISSSDLIKVSEKINHLIAIERLNSWKDNVYLKFTKCWAKYFSFDPKCVPDWLYQDDIIALLLPIVDLEKGPRRLAVRVVKNRGDSPPWDFRHESNNSRFIEKVKTKGIVIDKWINGIGSRTYQISESAQIHINVSQDPLEIVNMGGHFKTCLSPGNFNFFSVFANIADINKQVIYGRNDAGKVIGRVLVGMTDVGGVKVFHRYFHDKNERFDEYVLEYINEWVREIGAVLVTTGDVKKLVAPDWYDDGSIDIDSGIACFNKDSDLRKNIVGMSSQAILNEFKRQLAPLPINELTFPMIIQLEEVQVHKALIFDLIAIAKEIPHLDDYTIIELFKLSLSHAYGEYFFHLFNKQLKRILYHQATNQYWMENEFISSLVQYDAIVVLRAFNKAKKIKDAYISPALKRGAIEALRKLGRPKQAENLRKSTL